MDDDVAESVSSYSTRSVAATADSSIELATEKHPTLHYNDGNIILIAQATRFRLYGGLLAHRSRVLEDMIYTALTQGSDIVEGCPSVILHDPVELVVHFLDTLLNGVPVIRGPHYPTWIQVKALLILGTKYKVEDLRNEGISCLQKWFPDTMDE